MIYGTFFNPDRVLAMKETITCLTISSIPTVYRAGTHMLHHANIRDLTDYFRVHPFFASNLRNTTLTPTPSSSKPTIAVDTFSGMFTAFPFSKSLNFLA
jgi:hypothetical protein